MTTLLWIAALLLILIGIVGVIIPGVPGVVAVFLGLLLAAWADNFTRVGWQTLLVLGILALASFLVDVFAAGLAVRTMGASRFALFGAAVGMMVGLLFGFVGVIIGPFIGAFIGELLARNDAMQAARAGLGAWLGLALGTAAKCALVFLMFGIFLIAYVL